MNNIFHFGQVVYLMQSKITLIQEKQAAFLQGHPWIYPNAIKNAHRCKTGELVSIVDEQDQCIATGVFNEHSLYRVRILAYAGDPVEHGNIASIIHYRLQQAITLRSLLNLDAQQTSAYRLFNSEADGLSGLTIDRFNQTLVVSSSAFWVEQHRQIIEDSLQQLISNIDIIWFSQAKSLKQDGWVAQEATLNERITQVQEAGVHFEINFLNTQKTGLFIDQRENHQRIAALARGKRVLDLYTYTGGFALHAAKAGASHVTAVDSSSAAIAQAKKNADLNQLSGIEFIAADARDYLTHAGEYDIIILDPPKLIPSKKHLTAAKNYYRFLHREMFKHMKPGSLLMTCNCSSAISSAQFNALVQTQAQVMEKTVRTLGIYGPSACHPTIASFPEGNYLTALLLAVV